MIRTAPTDRDTGNFIVTKILHNFTAPCSFTLIAVSRIRKPYWQKEQNVLLRVLNARYVHQITQHLQKYEPYILHAVNHCMVLGTNSHYFPIQH